MIIAGMALMGWGAGCCQMAAFALPELRKSDVCSKPTKRKLTAHSNSSKQVATHRCCHCRRRNFLHGHRRTRHGQIRQHSRADAPQRGWSELALDLLGGRYRVCHLWCTGLVALLPTKAPKRRKSLFITFEAYLMLTYSSDSVGQSHQRTRLPRSDPLHLWIGADPYRCC